MDNYNKIKNLTIEQIINLLFEIKNNETSSCVRNEIYKCIFANKDVDYKGLYLLLPSLDEDDISIFLQKSELLIILSEFYDYYQKKDNEYKSVKPIGRALEELNDNLIH